jgi:hypothetical protein
VRNGRLKAAKIYQGDFLLAHGGLAMLYAAIN